MSLELFKLNKLKSINSPVLITGHTGFKGTWLMLLLDSLDIPYVGLSLEPSRDALYTKVRVSNLEREIFGDIRESSVVEKVFLELSPQVIFHLAAQPLVIDSYKNPLETFQTNVMGTANILEAARKLNIDTFSGVITTDKVYRNDEKGNKFLETDALMGSDPYSASKAAAENVISAWRSLNGDIEKSFITSLRAGNVIGGGDLAENRLLPDLYRALQRDESPVIRNPNSVRPWQHVLDPLVGYLFALERSIELRASSDYNFGPIDDALDVGTVAEIACKAWNSTSKPLFTGTQKEFHEAGLLDLSSKKAQKELNWRPCFSQGEAVSETIEWWKIYREANANEACARDLVRVRNHYQI
jgi:CDP-glucose 4,6-dehydratase